MLKRLFYSLILFALFQGCTSGDNYEYWDLSRFKISENVLQEREDVKMLYTSQAPDNNDGKKYYIHLIVVSEKAGDTVNVLTTINNHFKPEDRDEIFYFFTVNSMISKILLMKPGEVENADLEKIKNTEQPKITKVARDPEFDYIADNDFTSVIGTIAKVVKGGQ